MVQFDFSKYAIGGATRPDSFTGMTEGMRSGLSLMLTAAESELGSGLQVYSGFRSPELQKKLFEDAVKKYGSVAAARKWVAPPGRSRHNTGQAADLKWNGVRLDQAPAEVREWVKNNAARFGLDVPMDWEPWQVEEAGARGQNVNPSASETKIEGVRVADSGSLDINALAEYFALSEGPKNSVADAYKSSGALDVSGLEGYFEQADPLQPRITEPVTPQPSEGRFQADIMRETAAPFADIARQAAAGVTGAGEGIADIPASIPLYGPDGPQIEIPEGVRNALNPILDAGIAALAGAGTIPAGLAGIGGDVLEALGASPQSARRFAQDVAAMPEAFAGSPQQVIRSRVPSAPAGRVDTPEAELIQTGAERGVRVLTSDVRQPKTWFGRWALASGEKIPVAGPGGQRAAQQQERLEAVRGLIREYSDDPNLSSDDLLALVADDIFTDQGQFVAKHAGMKQDVFENVKDAGPVPITNTEKRVNELIDQHVGKENRASKAIVDAATKWWYDLQRNGGIYDVERMRKLLGDEFSDLPGSEQQKAMNSLYGPLRADIEAFVLDKGGRAELNKLMVSNKKLSENMDEVKKTSLRTVLSKGDVSPEIVKNMLFSAKTSDVRNVFKKLSPEGKSNARAAILQDALERATNVDDISPKRFVSNLDKRARQIGVVFSEDDKRAIDGFMRLMKATERADEAGVVTMTGQQAVPIVGTAVITDLLGTAGGSLAAIGGLGGLARLYESPSTRKLLVKMSRVDPGSKQEIELTQKLMTEMEKLLPSEAVTRGVQAATVATQGIETDE